MSTGLSFVICTRNGASRLPATLAHLRAQRLRSETRHEVLVVDNASSDDTRSVAIRHFTGSSIPLRVVHEPRPGTGFARVTGLREARYDYVTFVDDDNWLEPDFGQRAFDIIHSDPTIGLVPARSEAVFAPGVRKPSWFDVLEHAFAVGSQFAHEGDVSHEFAHWWTAGMTLRRRAWDDLLACGFKPRLKGRDGRSLAAGEDTEIGLALLLAGWRAHYDARLCFKHFMPRERLTWSYVCRLSFQGQHPLPLLSAYRQVLRDRNRAFDERHEHPAWAGTMLHQLARGLRRGPLYALRLLATGRGELLVLRVLCALGTLDATRRYGALREPLIRELRTAHWLGGGPARVQSLSSSTPAVRARDASVP